MNVEIVSRKNIRPSSSSINTCETPPHPKRHALSEFDQCTQPVYISLVLFYSPPHHIHVDDMNRILKDSLSRVLDRFYPLAGTITHDDSSSIDCNDQGVEYAVARVNCDVATALGKPSMEMLGQLLPHKRVLATCNDPFVLVQVNMFLCGGMALAVQISHQVADGASRTIFVEGWSKTALGYPDAVVPDFTSSPARFPPVKGSNPPKQKEEDIISEGVTRRFVFEESKISKLKQYMAAIDNQVKDPTRVEAVSCFVWKRIVNVSKKAAAAAAPQEGRRIRPLAATTALFGGVDVRASLVPPLPRYYLRIARFVLLSLLGCIVRTNLAIRRKYAFGNVLGVLCPLGDESDIESTGGVRLFRESVVEARRHGVGAAGGKNAAAVTKIINKTDVGMKRYGYASLRRMPLYEADFGWGKPTWVSFGDIKARNSIRLLEAADGRGIEVWVKLVEEEMVLFEQDQELLEFATLNPPVVVLNNKFSKL